MIHLRIFTKIKMSCYVTSYHVTSKLAILLPSSLVVRSFAKEKALFLSVKGHGWEQSN